MTPTTHLLLVSNQPTPNLTPALDPAVRPERVILLVSPDMTRRADWLQSVLGPRGIRVERWPIDDAWDVEHIQFRVLELLEAERALIAAGAIALNATGGTKPMAIAAFDAFRAYELPVYYVHPERDRLLWMHPSDRPAVELANRVRLDDFLAAHGTRLIARVDDAVPEPQRQLTDWLVAQNARIAEPLGTLNWLANGAERDLRSPVLERRQMQDADLAELIRRFAEAGLLQVRRDRLHFPDEAARFYVNGGWLEAHVYDLLRRLRKDLGASPEHSPAANPEPLEEQTASANAKAKRSEPASGATARIQDLARSVDIARDGARGEPVPNEIDVACLAENRLYIIECKTRRWGDGEAYGPGANALYRLDALADLLGGLQARAMLVSYRDLPGHVLGRAADLRIQLCDGPRLPELPALLRRWLTPSPP